MKKLGRRVPYGRTKIYYGNKLRSLPPGFRGMYKIKSKDIKSRSKRSLDILSNRFDIIWKDYYYYLVGHHDKDVKRSYMVYGYIGKERFTYHVYKHAGLNIGDVFLRFGNGNRILCSILTADNFPIPLHDKESKSVKHLLNYLLELVKNKRTDQKTRLKIEKILFKVM
ncbi:MAG: hypothetical protein R3250_05750 [Melioribacteraceae bacterium]|nr:hypothetical protein [Melioribacteraceae bacterium]